MRNAAGGRDNYSAQTNCLYSTNIIIIADEIISNVFATSTTTTATANLRESNGNNAIAIYNRDAIHRSAIYLRCHGDSRLLALANASCSSSEVARIHAIAIATASILFNLGLAHHHIMIIISGFDSIRFVTVSSSSMTANANVRYSFTISFH